MTKQIQIPRPDDWHIHLREGEMLRTVLPYTSQYFGRVLVMPNTTEPILTGREAFAYRHEIFDATPTAHKHFKPVMSIKLTMRTTTHTIHQATRRGVKAAKLYPTNATTNSDDGVEFGRLKELAEVFNAMSMCGMVLCIHGEEPSQPVLDREPYVVPFIQQLINDYPGLKLVVEHVSTKAMAKFVTGQDCTRVAATVTAHHLYLTLDDLLGGELITPYFCKPVVKTAEDREYLWFCVERYRNFFFGSDSAPHLVTRKESCSCAAGAFTAPILLPLLAQMFDQRDCLDQLQEFVSYRGADFYGFEPSTDLITLQFCEKPLLAQNRTEDGTAWIMPLKDGEDLHWKVLG